MKHGSPSVSGPPAVDGLVCFGSVDYWYHNKGHFDIQIVRHFAPHVATLYINSIGMRASLPKTGDAFAIRAARKIASYRRGFKKVDEGFAVCSPISMPTTRLRSINEEFLYWQVRRFIKRSGIERPLYWCAIPTSWPVIRKLNAQHVVYQRTDKFEEFPSVDTNYVLECDSCLKDGALATMYVSEKLYSVEKGNCDNAVYLGHGVDYDKFSGMRGSGMPGDLAVIPKPRVGFVGSIDMHTFDAEFFLKVASLLPNISFILVGKTTLEPKMFQRSNIYLLGQKEYDIIANYTRSFDALIMTWNDSEWIKYCSPVKLKEYLATGMPIVSTPFGELDRYGSLVYTAPDPESFAVAVVAALKEDSDELRFQRQRSVAAESWESKISRIREIVSKGGIALDWH